MAFPPRFLEDLRGRVSLAELIGRRVRLIRRGREHSGLCPFHNEKSPSFTVSEDKGFFHCFGCGAHGDAIEFLRRIDNLTFAEAVERLAQDAGLPLPAVDGAERERSERLATLQQVLEAAMAWYQSQLSGQAGANARRYLQERGLGEETVARFRLGYAPGGRTALKQAMLARGVAERLLVEAGMLVVPEEGGASYDRFRDRVIFPITDRRGRVIAFGGRALGDIKPKYLNSPDTPLFHKGQVLYNLALAREAARTAGGIVVTEGYMDVIALAQAGLGHAVAPLGTALTAEQLQLLWRLVPEPILCFDGDAAGLRAADRAAERCLPLLQPGRSLRFALLPQGEDPDSLVRRSGLPAVAEVLQAALPLVELLWQRAVAGAPLDTPEQRALLQQRLFDLTQQIGDKSVQSYYRLWFRDRLAETFDRSRRPAAGPQRHSGQTVRPASRPPPLPGETWRRERLLVLTILHHPALLERSDVDEAFAAVELVSPGLDRLRQAIIQEVARNPGLDSDNLKRHLSASGFAEALTRLAGSAQSDMQRFAWPGASLAEAASGWAHVLTRHRHEGAKQELLLAEAALARDMNEETLRRFRATQEFVAALGREAAEQEELAAASGGEAAL